MIQAVLQSLRKIIALPSDPLEHELTVLVCDLTQAAQLVEQLDPEDLRDVMRAYHTTCERVLTQYEGYLAQRLGSRLVVYFGYPRAQEDAAHRAVLTGLALLEALSALNLEIVQQPAVRLSVQVGIDSGLVVVETEGDERAGPVAIGSPLSRAVQLQEAAAPQGVVISSDTQHLVQDWFRCHELSPHGFEGSDTTVPIYQVIERSGAQHRLEAAPPGGLTPLVGREHEVGLLSERWQRVCEGQGQVILLSGEAGIGKSRLVQVLKDHLTEGYHTQLECWSLPYFSNSALYPIIDMIQRAWRFQSDDTPEQKLEKLTQNLSQYRHPVDEMVPLFGTLLSLPVPEDRYPTLNLSPHRQRQRTLEAIVAMILELSERQPVLFILEDLHWTDPTTLELLDLLIDQTPTASTCVLVTCRPDFQPSWSHRSYLTEVTVNRLSSNQIEWMVQQVADGKGLPAEAIQHLVDKTDGVPLYVEEMTKSVLESGMLKKVDGNYELIGHISSLAIPTTLQDSLMARLDRLVTAKAVAQYASVIGRQFSYELLQAVSPLDEAMLQHQLACLVETELVYQRGLPPQATYTFKHALIQDIAYGSLLRRSRQGCHHRIAQVLEERFPETSEAEPELLAHHYTEAGLNEQSVRYWRNAGQKAIERSAHVEAIEHFQKGLGILSGLPDAPNRKEHELSLQIDLGGSLMTIKGYGAPEVEQAYARAYELSQYLGNTPRLFEALAGLRVYHQVIGRLQRALEIGEQCRRIAQEMQDPTHLVQVYGMLGHTLYYQGEFSRARILLEQGLALYEAEQLCYQVFTNGVEAGMFLLATLGRVLWPLGYPDKALESVRQAVSIAQELSHPQSMDQALMAASWVHQHRLEESAVLTQAAMAVAIAREQGFQMRMAMGTMMQGWRLAMQQHGTMAVEQIRQGLADYRATGARSGSTHFFVLLIEACLKVDQIEEGLSKVTEALDWLDRNEGEDRSAELYRLKGELLFKQQGLATSEAETCFHQALDIARRQQAKSWELRTATSLAHLWQSQGKRDEARELLEPIYSWFTEGFDTADLIDAKTLLDELASSEVLEQTASGMAGEALIEERHGNITKTAIAEAMQVANQSLLKPVEASDGSA